MRVVKLAEFEIECDACHATLAATSEDVKTACGGTIAWIKCPVCGETITLKHYNN